MTLLLKQLFSLLKILHSETGTLSLALGISFGFILGMSPLFSLQSIFVFLILLIFRVQFGAALVSSFFFSFVAYLLDPIFDKMGHQILSQESLTPLFEKMYNMPLVPFTKFNNTVVMGAGVTSLILFPLVLIISYFLILKYRKAVVSRIKGTKLWKALQSTSLYQWYYKYNQLY